MNTDTMLLALLWAQLRRMRIDGYDVYVGCPDGPNREWIEKHGFTYVPFDFRRAITPVVDIRVLAQLFFFMRREKFEVVFTHTAKVALLGQVAARFAGVPVILNTLHGLYFDSLTHWIAKRFYVFLAKCGSRCATLTLSQNRDDIDTAIKYKICHPDRIEFLGNGTDLRRFDPARFNGDFRERKRAELGIDNGRHVLLMVARLVRDKGYLEMFEALQTLRRERDDFTFVMVGLAEEYRSGRISPDEYKKYGLADCTLYFGARDDIDELMACADVYVQPSRQREGVPRSAIEAAAMGLPIVTTNSRGCRDVVRPDVNGLLVPPCDAQALADGIRKLMDDADLRHRFGEAGKRWAQDNFSEEAVCDRVSEHIHEGLLAAGVKPPIHKPELNNDLPLKAPFVW